MPQPTPEIHENFTMGSVLDRPIDRLPEGAMRLLRNARIDRTRQTVSSRHGSLTQTNAFVGPTPVIYALSKLNARAGAHYYAQITDGVTSSLWRLNASLLGATLLHPFLVPTQVSSVSFLDGGGLTEAGAETPGIWQFYVGPGSGKDNGTVRRDIGLVQPTDPPASAALGTRKRLSIHTFDSDAILGDTGTVAGAVMGAPILQEGSNSVVFSVPPDGLGTIFAGMGFPSASGAWMVGTDNSGASNKPSMQDTTKNFFTLGLTRGSRFRNLTDGSEGIITRFTADTLFFDGGLQGGIDNDIDHGDNYEIFFNLAHFDIYPTSGTDNGTTSNRLDRVIDSTKNFDALHVRPGMKVWNLVNGCSGTISSIATTVNTNDTLVCAGGFAGSTENDFDAGDGYVIVDTLVSDDDYIHLQIRCDFPEDIEWIQLDFDSDSTDAANAFRTNFYTLRLPGNALTEGRDTWTELLQPKSAFTEQGTPDWARIKSWRLSVRMTRQGGGTIWVDDLSLVGGYGIEGDIEYTAIYRASSTGGKSNPPVTEDREVLHTLKVEAKRHPVTLNLTNLANPANPEIDLIEIYRRGGTLTDWTLIDRVSDATTTYSDTVHDAVVALGADPETGELEILERDNDVMPTGAVRLFGPGAFSRLFAVVDRHKVSYSKAWEPNESRAEQWPKDFFFLVGDGSTRVMNGLVIDTNGFVYTEDASYLFVGRGEDTFLPQAIPQSHGLIARNALTFGDGQIFLLSGDGIYSQRGMSQTKLTAHLDPFFANETVDGLLPMDRTAISECTLSYYDPPGDPQVLLTYREATTSRWRTLVLKRNAETGQYTDASFDTYPFDPYMPLVDPIGPHLLCGTRGGTIELLEYTGNPADTATGIAMEIVTPASSQRSPNLPKEYQQVWMEADSNGQAVTVTALTDKGETSTPLGAFSSTSSQTPTLFTTNLPTGQAYNLALRLQATLTARLTLYRYGWSFIAHPMPVTELDLGETVFGTRHVLRHLWADLATAGTVTVAITIDGMAIPTMNMGPTVGRQRVDLLVTETASLLRRGKVFALTLTGTATLQLYGMTGIFEREPDEVTFLDTRNVSFDTVQLLSRLECDLEAPGGLLASIYVDGVPRYSRTFPATTGRQRRSVPVPAELKGYAFRVVLTSDVAFQSYGIWGRFREWRSVRFHQSHPLNTIDTLTVERNFLEGRVA